MASHIWRGPALDVPQHVTVPDLVIKAAERHSERVALVDSGSGRGITYTALIDCMRRVACALRARGARPETCLAIYAPNSSEWVIAALAMMQAGGTVTGASPLMKTTELARHLHLSKARFLLTIAPLLEVAREAAAKAGGLELIVADATVAGTIPFSELLAWTPRDDGPVVGDDAVAMLPFSSGTTSLPKPVELTHRALVTAALQARASLGLGPDDTLLALPPLSFILGSAIVMLGGLTAGATLVLMPQYEFRFLLDSLQRYRISVAVLVPPIMKALAEQPAVEDCDFSHLRLIVCGGAHVLAGIEERVSRRLGTTVVQGYGMTEASATTAINPSDAPRPGTCGKLFPLVEARIVDPDTGEDQGADATGELWVRTPSVMNGYLDDSGATRDIFSPDGWLRTGDIGFFDTDEYFHLTARLKELIKVNALPVAPAELEAVLVTHPAVADVAVIGRPNDKTGEIPVAYVVPRVSVEASELISWVAARVASYKKIRAIEFVDQIPRSPAGKILRRMLRGA